MKKRKLNIKYDAIVIGAGPAGAICAYKLAKIGKKVLLVEKQKLPRNKACTGIVTQEAMNIIKKETGKSPKKKCVFPYYYNVFTYYMQYHSLPINIEIHEKEKCYSFNRSEFDLWLVNRVKEQSVDVIEECTYIEIVYMSNELVKTKLMLRKNGQIEYVEIESKYLIAADGMNSKIRTQLFPERSVIKKNFCRQEYYEGTCSLDPHGYHTFVTNPVAEEPIWVFFKDKYIVLGFHAYSKEIIKDKRKELITYLHEKYNLKIGKFVRSEVCCETTNYTIQKIKKSKLDFVLGKKQYPILFVGEAAEVVDTISSGICVALKTGCLAAEAISVFESTKLGNNRSLYGIYKELCKDIVNDITMNWTSFYNKMGRFFEY